MMTLAEVNQKIYENDIEYYFHEFFENKGINIDTDFKEVPNNMYHGAFIYVYNKCFALSFTDGRSKNKVIDDIAGLFKAYNTYVKIIRDYNIISFTDMFLDYIGINYDKLYRWKSNTIEMDIDNIKEFILYNQNIKVPQDKNKPIFKDIYNNTIVYGYSDLLNYLRKSVATNISNLGKSTLRGKLSDDRTGMIVLANNDGDIGLEYDSKRNTDRVETALRLATQLPKLSIVDGITKLSD